MFSFFDVILLLGIGQGALLIVSLQLIKHKNKVANKALSSLLIISCLVLLGRINVDRFSGNWGWRFGTFADGIIFLLGPFLYSYVRRLLVKDERPFSLTWPHYLPVITYLVYAVVSLFFSKEDFGQLYRSGYLIFIFLAIELLGILSFSFYWFKSYRLFYRLKRQQKELISYESSATNYMNFLLFSMLFCIICWLISFSSFYLLGHYLKWINYNTMWIGTAFFLYVVGYFSLTQPEVFRIKLKALSPSIPRLTRRMNEEQIRQAQALLEQVMLNDKLYLKPDLSLSTLAQQLQLSPNDLSWLLNEIYGKNFYAFINQYRIDDFLARIANNEHKKQTILGIAMDVGFNSKSTFNKFFKSVLNETPSAYIKQLNSSN